MLPRFRSVVTRVRATQAAVHSACLIAITFCALGAGGCSTPQPNEITAPPEPAFRGPKFLWGTVGSMARLDGFSPQYVGGYGLVVGLDGTGSAEVPRAGGIRQRILADARKGGFGSSRYDMRHMTPEQIIASKNTAVVAIEGLIPAGAKAGEQFDLLITALDGTQTTSLEGGVLYTTDLAPGGLDIGTGYRRSAAKASGSMYISPRAFTGDDQRRDHYRTAVVLDGGRVTADQKLSLYLNEPNYNRAHLMANRINERFERNFSVDRADTAEAKSDQVVVINIPDRYRNQPERLVGLIENLYVQVGIDPEAQAQRLAGVLERYPNYAPQIIQAWEALGRTVIPVLREHYRSSSPHVAIAAIDAGARLGDESVLTQLSMMSASRNPADRTRVALILRWLPDSIRAESILEGLINDPETAVRIVAYEVLAERGSPSLQRYIVGTPASGKKFTIDLVLNAREPLIYINQRNNPRIVVFNAYAGFKMPMLASIWNRRLLVKGDAGDSAMTIYYKMEGVDAITIPCAPAVANFARVLGQSPEFRSEPNGLDLPYSRVISAIYEIDRAGLINAPIVFEENPLAQAIETRRDLEEAGERPETGGDVPDEDLLESDSLMSHNPDAGPSDSSVSERPDTSP